MATTTPNFGWAVPTSTDLVKDGAVAIETLGDSIDASLVDLKGGTTGQVLAKASGTDMDFSWVAQDDSNAIQNAIVDAKGDLIGATANDTPARLAVGTNGQVLTADSTAATGLAWATPSSGGGYTLLSTTTLSGTTTTVSSISGSYKHLFIYAKGVTSGLNGDRMTVRLNGATSGYAFNLLRTIGTTVVSAFEAADTSLDVISRICTGGTQAKLAFSEMWIYRYTDTNYVYGTVQSQGHNDTDGSSTRLTFQYDGTAAVDSISFISPNGSSLSGTIYIYGVN